MNATNRVLEAAPAPKKYAMTSAKRGEETELFTQLQTNQPLSLVTGSASAQETSATQRVARIAALTRWHRARKAAGSDMTLAQSVSSALALPENARQPRRGEFKHISGSYHNYSAEELLDIIEKCRSKQLKLTEMERLYAENKQRVPPNTVLRVPHNNT